MKQLRQRIADLEHHHPDNGDATLARIADRLKAAGQMDDDDARDGFEPPEGYDQMTIGEQTLTYLAWKHRDA